MVKSKKGFTIIEVVLVLAIAGLIFLMVFVALPTLQRSQRDTQKRQDVAMVVTAITNWQTNGYPDTSAGGVWVQQDNNSAQRAQSWSTGTNVRYAQNNRNGTYRNNGCSPTNLYQASNLLCNYLGGENFTAPNGDHYTLTIYSPGSQNNEYVVPTDETYGLNRGNSIVVVFFSTCGSNGTVNVNNALKKFSVLTKTEGSGVICLDNS